MAEPTTRGATMPPGRGAEGRGRRVRRWGRRVRGWAHGLGARGRGVGGRGRRVLAAAGLLAIAAAAAAWLLLARPGARPSPGLAAPPLRGAAVPCRRDPTAHVHDPTRLVLVGRCSTVGGTVREVHYEPRYGNQRLLVTVDPPYLRFLPPANRGVLTVEVLPPDETSVRIPRVGQHAWFHGAFVFDKNQRAIELHPAWRIDVTGAAPPAAPPRGSGPRFLARAHAPAAVAVGDTMAVLVRANLLWRGRQRPAPGAHVFVELTSPRGRGVQWAAATTNSAGDATVHLVALQAPGQFTLTLWANHPELGRQVITTLPLKVLRT